MKITSGNLPFIEKALGITFYEGQKQYLLNDNTYYYGGRQTGKTLAYCVKLALSDGIPLNVTQPWKFCDNDCGTVNNVSSYSKWFLCYFHKIWSALKRAGLPVRNLTT